MTRSREMDDWESIRLIDRIIIEMHPVYSENGNRWKKLAGRLLAGNLYAKEV